MEQRTDRPHNFEDVHKLLGQYLPPARSQRGAYTLERMTKLMEFLDNPQDSYKVIHVAGTSGKTSTCYYVASLLKQAGVRAGLTVSPHIDELNERAQINLRPLTEKKFCSEFGIFLNLVHESGVKPTYFEILAAFAFWEFKRAGCDYAVVEVGLGGLLDATNVISRKDKLNIITDIGLDHQKVLGETPALIATKKAGIIKPYNTVVCYEQDEEIMQVIREVSAQQQAELHEVWPLKSGELPRNLPLFQRRNWYLALSAYNILAERDGLPELNETQLAESTAVYIPARMEVQTAGGKTVIMDGAHNQQKLKVLVRSVKRAYPEQKIPILVSFLATKQDKLRQCLEALLPLSDRLIITTFATEHREKVSVDPLKIAAACEELGYEDWQIVDDPGKAFKTLVKSNGQILLVAGSFYLLNHVRPLIFKQKPK